MDRSRAFDVEQIGWHPMIQLVLVLLALWLVALTVVVVGLARHQAIVQLANVAGPPRLNMDADGPEVGSEVPGEVIRLLDDSAPRWSDYGRSVVLFMSASCGPCRDVAAAIVGQREFSADVTFLIAGRRDVSRDLLETLKPTGRPVILNPEAQDIMRLMNVHSSPFAFAIVQGKVEGKRFIRTAEDVALLRDTLLTVGGVVK